MNKRTVGTTYEGLAVAFLENHGVKIVCKNYRCRFGEIDLIGYDGAYLVFFEVKYRSDEKMGVPEEAIDYRKQKKICKVADFYIMMNTINPYAPMRFDAVAIQGKQIHWYKNAFEAN